MTGVRFRSRIDGVIGACLALPVILPLYILWTHRHDGVGTPWVIISVVAATAAFVMWVVLDTSYTVTDTALVIRSGPQRVHVPLASIRRARRSHTLIAAPALALRRLEIDYGTAGLAVISPEREAEFLSLLRIRVPAVDLSTFPELRPA